MGNYTILKEECPTWDEQKQSFFNEVDKNIFKLDEVKLNRSKFLYTAFTVFITEMGSNSIKQTYSNT